MSNSKTFVRASAFALVTLACQSEPVVFERDAAREVATAYCEQLFACSCRDSAQFRSEEACMSTMEEELFEQQLDANDEALLYDQSCVQNTVARIGQQECTRDPEALEVCDDCFIYHGRVPEDGECERVGPFSDCAQGLVCVTQIDDDDEPIDVCMPACSRVREGQPCEVQADGFTKLMACDDGLFCDLEDSKLCVALPGPGEPCMDDVTCAPQAWCDAANDPPICASFKANGQGCEADLECESTWCRNAERCAEPLPAGLGCDPEKDRCALGFLCDADEEMCVASDALICAAPRMSF